MEEKQGVYWYQGMLLQPQHFQAADHYHQFTQSPLFDSIVPHFWGVGELDISRSAIANRTIEVTRAKLVFRDRHYVEYPDNAIIPARAFDVHWIDGDRPLLVYLGMRKPSRQERNVTEVGSLSDAGAVTTRFAAVMDVPDVPDLYSAGPAAPLHSLLSVVRVFFESEVDNLGDFDLVPIARLVRDGDTVVLSETFIAPSYALDGSEALQTLLRELRDDLAGRARQLQEYKSPREMQKAEFDASYVVFLLALRSLNRFAPQLFHLIEARQIHPWNAYSLLRQIVGELSSFSERFNMMGEMEQGGGGLPSYDHTNLEHCFGQARTLISYLLNEITVGPEFLVVLEPRGDMLVGLLPRTAFAQRNRFYLVIRTDDDPAMVAESVTGTARLSAASEIPTLMRHALPGLELIHLPNAPQGLPRRANSHYFRIEQVSDQWERVERDGEIALQWVDGPPDVRAEIVILRR